MTLRAKPFGMSSVPLSVTRTRWSALRGVIPRLAGAQLTWLARGTAVIACTQFECYPCLQVSLRVFICFLGSYAMAECGREHPFSEAKEHQPARHHDPQGIVPRCLALGVVCP